MEPKPEPGQADVRFPKLMRAIGVPLTLLGIFLVIWDTMAMEGAVGPAPPLVHPLGLVLFPIGAALLVVATRDIRRAKRANEAAADGGPRTR